MSVLTSSGRIGGDASEAHRPGADDIALTFPMNKESRRRFQKVWIASGGTIEDVRRTGEERYRHPHCAHPIRTNKRRKDVPAKLLSCLQAVHRQLLEARHC